MRSSSAPLALRRHSHSLYSCMNPLLPTRRPGTGSGLPPADDAQKEQLIADGDRHLLYWGRLGVARAAYVVAGMEIPKEKLIALGDHCLEAERALARRAGG
jgi:hypothetical protein